MTTWFTSRKLSIQLIFFFAMILIIFSFSQQDTINDIISVDSIPIPQDSSKMVNKKIANMDNDLILQKFTNSIPNNQSERKITVGELIKKLQEFDSNKEVVIYHVELDHFPDLLRVLQVVDVENRQKHSEIPINNNHVSINVTSLKTF